MPLREKFLASPIGYSLWSAPLNGQKLERILPLLTRLGGVRDKRVLDLGCGPGVNARLFQNAASYLGVDVSERYISDARRQFPELGFVVGDATQVVSPNAFDIVLINSLLHHLDDDRARATLRAALTALRADGAVVVQEPLRPPRKALLARLTMAADRGEHFRHQEHWRELVRQGGLQPIEESTYPMRILGLQGWTMYSLLARANSRPQTIV